MNIVAVVIIYNRIELLKRIVHCLRQNRPVSLVIVVNDESTGATAEWLRTQPGLTVISQANVGGSGGFYTGIQHACQAGADRIWYMDDDVFPCTDCLEQLLLRAGREGIGILAPRRLQEGKLFMHEFQGYNSINPFASTYTGKLSRQTVTELVEIQEAAFKGPFVRRGIAEKIDYPNKELFIFCDDTDYCLRTVQAEFKILYIPTTLTNKEKFFLNDSWGERNRRKRWKRLYQVRNSTYLSHHYGRNWAVRYLRGFDGVAGYILTALLTCPLTGAYQWSNIAELWKAYCNGAHERLGKMQWTLQESAKFLTNYFRMTEIFQNANIKISQYLTVLN